jgi:RimJ/RimL family protein N-acetyltransferase
MPHSDLKAVQLSPEQAMAYKQARLRALQSDPACFGSTYARELAYEDQRWRDVIANPQGGVFAVFDDDAVVAIAGIQQDDETPADAIFWGIWVAPDYRGRGVVSRLYQAVFDWAAERPVVTRIVMSRRESNTQAEGAMMRHGFKHTYTNPAKLWADGVTEAQIFYARELN